MLAPGTLALNQGVEFSGIDDLIDLKTTNVAGIYSDLDARLNIAASCNDALDVDKAPDLLRPHISHPLNRLFLVLSMNDEDLVLSLELWRELNFDVLGYSCTIRSSHLGCGLEVEPSLVHKDLKGRELVLPEVNSGLRHVSVDDLRE